MGTQVLGLVVAVGMAAAMLAALRSANKKKFVSEFLVTLPEVCWVFSAFLWRILVAILKGIIKFFS